MLYILGHENNVHTFSFSRPKEAKLLPGSPKRETLPIIIPDEQHLVFNKLNFPDSDSLKAKVLECMQAKQTGKVLSQDNA